MRLRVSFSFNFPKLCVSISITAGCSGPPRQSMSLHFTVVFQTWRACPSMFVGLCSFKSLGECAGVISASLFLSGLPLGLLVYMDEGGTLRLKHAHQSSWGGGGCGAQNVASLEESKWETPGKRINKQQGKKLTAQWLHAHSVFTPLLHCWVWMMPSPEWLPGRTKSTPLKPDSTVTGLSLTPQSLTRRTIEGSAFFEGLVTPLFLKGCWSATDWSHNTAHTLNNTFFKVWPLTEGAIPS